MSFINWELIENSRAGMDYRTLQEVARTNAEKRRQIAEQADHCVNWLRAQGLEVLAINEGPRITIRRSPLCEQFEGAVTGYSRGPKGEEWYKEVIRLDCAVRWMDWGDLSTQQERDGRSAR